MGESKEKSVIIYAGEDLVDLLVLNGLVPALVDMGIKPIIAFPKKPHLKNPNLSNPDIQKYGFYQHDVIQETIIPFLDSKPTVLDSSGGLRDDTCYTANQLAQYFDLEVRHIENVNSAEHVQSIKDDNSLVGALSIRCMQTFRQPLIDAISEKGFFWNAHPGKLPEFKGVIPVFRAMLAGDKSLEWTLHVIDKGPVQGQSVKDVLDTGAKLYATRQLVDMKKSVFWHYNTNANNVTAMILGHLQDALAGKKIQRFVQDKTKGEYHSYPEQDLTNEFHEAGGMLVEPRNKMEKFLAKVFVPHVNPNRAEFFHILSKAIDDKFGANVTSYTLAAPAASSASNDEVTFRRALG